MKRFGSQGFSLLEMLIGMVILVFALTGISLVTRSASTGNMLGRDVSDAASWINSFVDSIRAVNPAALTKNAEQTRTTAAGTTRWWIYDNTNSSPPAYRQPAGVYLLTAKFTWNKSGRAHNIETSTFLGN